MHYRTARPKHAQPPYPLARLYRVTNGAAHVYERRSVSSPTLTTLWRGALFHALPDAAWLRRVGGGYIVGATAMEVV